MTRLLAMAAAGALFLGCGASTDDAPHVVLADIELAPPPDWQVAELGPLARTWTPATNPRKESLTVIVGSEFLGTPERALERARIAQGTLRGGRQLASTPLVTANGLVGSRFDATFTPHTGGGRVYHRSHVSVVAAGRTIHVLYTAMEPEPTRGVLRRVVDSIQAGG